MISDEQKRICQAVGAEAMASPRNHVIGASRNLMSGTMPINGLRHPPVGNSTGWYIWAGEELSEDPEFFVPLHVAHVDECSPAIEKYLALPSGWRFLTDGVYEDIWYDETLLELSD